MNIQVCGWFSLRLFPCWYESQVKWWENKLLFINCVAIYFCANIWMKIILLPVVSIQSSMICFSFFFSFSPFQNFFYTTKFFFTDSFPLFTQLLWYGISIFCQTSVKYAESFWSVSFNFSHEFKRNFTFLYMWYFHSKQFLFIFFLSLALSVSRCARDLIFSSIFFVHIHNLNIEQKKKP